MWAPICDVWPGSIFFTHWSRFATVQWSVPCHLGWHSGQTLRILYHMASRSKHNCENKLVVDITLVYWNVSCRPVNVASIDRGVVSIWHMPGAEQRAEHGCDSLLYCST